MGLKAVISLKEADNNVRKNVKLTLTHFLTTGWVMQLVNNLTLKSKERKFLGALKCFAL